MPGCLVLRHCEIERLGVPRVTLNLTVPEGRVSSSYQRLGDLIRTAGRKITCRPTPADSSGVVILTGPSSRQGG
jgi:hypothetical protein